IDFPMLKTPRITRMIRMGAVHPDHPRHPRHTTLVIRSFFGRGNPHFLKLNRRPREKVAIWPHAFVHDRFTACVHLATPDMTQTPRSRAATISIWIGLSGSCSAETNDADVAAQLLLLTPGGI